jgi:hypothetical protein
MDVRAEQLQHAPVRLGAPNVIEGEGVTHVYHDVTYPDPLDANRRDRRSLLGRVARSCCLIDLRDGAVMSGDRDFDRSTVGVDRAVAAELEGQAQQAVS